LEESDNVLLKSPMIRRDSERNVNRAPLAPLSSNHKIGLNVVLQDHNGNFKSQKSGNLLKGNPLFRNSSISRKSNHTQNGHNQSGQNYDNEDKENVFNHNIMLQSNPRRQKRKSTIKEEVFGRNVVVDVMPSEDVQSKASFNKSLSVYQGNNEKNESLTPSHNIVNNLQINSSRSQSPISRRALSKTAKNPLMSVTRLRRNKNRSISQHQKSENLSIRKARKYRAGQEDLERRPSRGINRREQYKRSRKDPQQNRSISSVNEKHLQTPHQQQQSHFGVHTTGHLGFYKPSRQQRPSNMDNSLTKHRREPSVPIVRGAQNLQGKNKKILKEVLKGPQHFRSNSLIPRRSAASSLQETLAVSNRFVKQLEKSPTDVNYPNKEKNVHNALPRSNRRIKIQEQSQQKENREQKRNYTIKNNIVITGGTSHYQNSSLVSMESGNNQRSRSVNNLVKKKDLRLRSPSPYQMTLDSQNLQNIQNSHHQHQKTQNTSQNLETLKTLNHRNPSQKSILGPRDFSKGSSRRVSDAGNGLASYASNNRGFHGFGVGGNRGFEYGKVRDEIQEKEKLKKKLFEASRKIRNNLSGREDGYGGGLLKRRKKFGKVFGNLKNVVEILEVNSSNIMGWMRF